MPPGGREAYAWPDGKVVGLDAQRCSEVFDEKGMFNPTFNECILKDFDADMVILAIGQAPETAFVRDVPDLNAGRTGWIMADALTLATSVPGIFAGGDIVTGPKTAIEAVNQGKEAAESIKRFLEGKGLKEGRFAKETELVCDVPIDIERRFRAQVPSIPVSEKGLRRGRNGPRRAGGPGRGGRCLNCRRCLGCKLCEDVCKPGAIDYLQGPEEMRINVGSVIVAAGLEEYDPSQKPELGYGLYKNVADEHRVRAHPVSDRAYLQHRAPSFRRHGPEEGRLAPVCGKPGQDKRILLLRLLHVRDEGGDHRERAPERHRADHLLHGRTGLRQRVRPVLRAGQARTRRAVCEIRHIADTGRPRDEGPRGRLRRRRRSGALGSVRPRGPVRGHEARPEPENLARVLDIGLNEYGSSTRLPEKPSVTTQGGHLRERRLRVAQGHPRDGHPGIRRRMRGCIHHL